MFLGFCVVVQQRNTIGQIKEYCSSIARLLGLWAFQALLIGILALEGWGGGGVNTFLNPQKCT